ncbi:hypothetical protein EV426DRAFT_718301 [Tirmania nivea]|nr:hypothetical protein EV426DRAFT_718301 [Tirmania nivea]
MDVIPQPQANVPDLPATIMELGLTASPVPKSWKIWHISIKKPLLRTGSRHSAMRNSNYRTKRFLDILSERRPGLLKINKLVAALFICGFLDLNLPETFFLLLLESFAGFP